MQRAGVFVVVAALWLGACVEGSDSRYTEPSLTCQRCSMASLHAGEALTFEASWMGMADSRSGRSSDDYPTCDPFRVTIACEGVACETTRNNPDGDHWPLPKAALLEIGGGDSCSTWPEVFEVRPVEGGVLTGSVELHNMVSDETEILQFGPIDVSPPVITPRADCGECGDYDRVGVGVSVDVTVRWDGEVGDDDPVGRQPFTVGIDCGEVSCEAQIDHSDEWGPLEPIVVPSQPSSRGVRVRLRATEAGLMHLTARLEHTDTGEVVDVDLAEIEHHRVDSLAILCVGGQLCDGQPEPNPSVSFGVVGVAGSTFVLVPPTVRFTSNVDDTPQSTHCSPEPYVDRIAGAGWACMGRLYEFEESNQYTLYAEWLGMTAELTAPAP